MTAPTAAIRRIQLVNPVSQNFDRYIVQNSEQWQVRALVELQALMDETDYTAVSDAYASVKRGLAWAEAPLYRRAVESCGLVPRIVVQEGEAQGQHVVICGAGPSLATHAREWCHQGDQVWGCNSALTYLYDRKFRVTHGITIDQTPEMLKEWGSVPPVSYLIASTTDPRLGRMLYDAERDIAKPVRFFHNFVGLPKPPVLWPDENGVMTEIAYEDFVYSVMYPATVRPGAGVNGVTRAIEVAQYMGFAKITVLGADCCIHVKGRHRTDLRQSSRKHLKWLRTHTVMHADGGHALASGATPVTLTAQIDPGTPDAEIRPGEGRWFTTKPDMAITAQSLLQMARASNGRIELVGDTFPNALRLKNDEYLKRLPNFELGE